MIELAASIFALKIRCDDVDWIHLAQGLVPGLYEYGNKPKYSIRGREFLHQLSDYSLLNKDCSIFGVAGMIILE